MTDLRRHVPPLTLVWDDEAPGALHRTVDGTLVFADVSGFTALTERLSRHGRIGAEEIVEALNRVFGPMLTIAASRGGELLKFGGDALLFLFRGDDHPEQACDAAVEMRASLRAAAAVPTSAGRFALSMSVGVHSGDIGLFLVGSPTRELLVLGPGASAVALAEKAADAGQVVVSDATAPRLVSGATRPRDDGALLLLRRKPRSRPGHAASVSPTGLDRMATLFPTALGEFLAPGPPDPEHRVATIAFVRFSGTDALLAARGPADLADVLHEVVTGVEEALAAEGVTLLATDLDTDGGKFFLGTGVPGTRGDDEGRMLRALRRMADADLPLPLQLGVARGNVFAAEVGVADRAAYSAMGDTTNTAARIMGTAPPGVVHAHPAVLERSRTLFAVTPRGPFRMKGKSAPVLVFEVGEELGSRQEARSGRLPFLGRAAELDVAQEALERALAGEGGVLTIEGPAGIGTTRLAGEALDAAGATRRLALRAEPYGTSSAYRVLRDPLRELLGLARASREEMGAALLRVLSERAPDLLPMAPLVADVVHVGVPDTPEAARVDPQYRADRVADVVVELLERLTPGPLAVVVEDAHWADGASVHLLGRLASATSGRPWAVVVVRRGDGDGFAPASGVRVLLEPLPADVVEQLVIAATEATPLRPHEVDAVVAKSGGNPLFVEEVTRLALGAGSLDELPESVQAAMGAQVDELPPAQRRLLRYCAVLGLSVRREVLEGTLAADGLSLDPATLTMLGGLLEADGPRPGPVPQQPGSRCRVRRPGVSGAGPCAPHCGRGAGAAQHRPRRRLPRPGAALRPRRRRPAHVGLRAAGRRPGPGVLRQRRRRRPLRDRAGGQPQGARSDRRRTGTALGAGRRPARAGGDVRRVGRGLPHCRTAEPGRPGRHGGGALSPGCRPTAHRRLHHHAAHGHPRAPPDRRLAAPRRPQHPGAARHAHRRRAGGAGAAARGAEWALRAMEGAGEAGEHETQVRALMLVDMVDLQLGVPGLGDRHREALEICVRHGLRSQEAKVRSNLGAMAYYAGRWTEAAQWYRTSRDVAFEAGSAFVAAQTDVNLGELLINQGHLDEAEQVLVRCGAGAARLRGGAVPRRGADAAGPGAPQPWGPRPGRGAGGGGRAVVQRARQPDERARGGPRARRGDRAPRPARGVPRRHHRGRA